MFKACKLKLIYRMIIILCFKEEHHSMFCKEMMHEKAIMRGVKINEKK